MLSRHQIYKCEVCGNIIKGLHGGKGILVCCGKPMILFTENTVDASKEKHVPILEKTDHGYVVKVGSVAHPMEENHYIEWIEVISDGKSYIEFLNPGQEPKANFCIESNNLIVRAYCNLHGLWKS